MSKLQAFSFSRLDSYETCPRKYHGINVSKTVKDTGNEHTQYGEEVHKAFAAYFKDNRSLPLHLRHLQQYLSPIKGAPGAKIVEQKLAIDTDYNGCDWFAKNTYCRVISDLTIINDNRAILFDWKTGKLKDDFTQLRLAGAVIFLLAPEVDTMQLVYFWTKDKKFTKAKMTRAEMPAVFNDLAPRLQRYQDAHVSGEFPARPSYLCRYCPDVKCPYNEVKK